MPQRYMLGSPKDFQEEVPQYCSTEGGDVLVFLTETGEWKVYDAACPHAGAMMGFGYCGKGHIITCPLHAWRFDLRTGDNLHPRLYGLTPRKFVLEEDVLYLVVEEEEGKI